MMFQEKIEPARISGARFVGIVALVMLFAPMGQAGTWSRGDFNPEGTTVMWFWVAWVVGALLCGIVSVLMQAFAKDEKTEAPAADGRAAKDPSDR